MQLRLLCVGRVRERYVAAACDDFLGRLRPYYRVEVAEIRPSQATAAASAVADEGERLLMRLQGEEAVWLLDRAGSELASKELSAALGRVEHAGTRRLTLVVAGTFGASDALRARATFLWSLSRLTFLHEWARMIVLEQLYRAAKIARNEPYHH